MKKKSVKIIKFIGKGFLVFLSLVCLYILSGIFISRIPFSQTSISKEKKEITIWLLSNNVHTDIVVPISTNYFNWDRFFPKSNTKKVSISSKYLAIGWGDKGFYLNTPQWSDLTIKTAFFAAFGLSSSAIHVTYLDTIKLSDQCVAIKLTKNEYIDLIAFIQNSVKKSEYNLPQFIKTEAVYGEFDAFYEANGSYHLFHTCNTWANNGLKAAHQKAAIWTPFESGIFYHYLDK